MAVSLCGGVAVGPFNRGGEARVPPFSSVGAAYII
jgi:hypothetical protein